MDQQLPQDMLPKDTFNTTMSEKQNDLINLVTLNIPVMITVKTTQKAMTFYSPTCMSACTFTFSVPSLKLFHHEPMFIAPHKRRSSAVPFMRLFYLFATRKPILFRLSSKLIKKGLFVDMS